MNDQHTSGALHWLLLWLGGRGEVGEVDVPTHARSAPHRLVEGRVGREAGLEAQPGVEHEQRAVGVAEVVVGVDAGA